MEWNKKILREKLIDSKVRPDFYCLDGGLPNESLCIDIEENFWIVYYSERGRRTGLQKFKSESEACKYFYDKTLKQRNVFLP